MGKEIGMNKYIQVLPRLFLTTFFLAGVLLATPARTMAQPKNLIRLGKGNPKFLGPGMQSIINKTSTSIVNQLERHAYKVPANAFKPSTPSLSSSTLGDIAERVALSDGKTPSLKRHSIAPSAVTILGSPAIVRIGDKNISDMRRRAMEQTTSEYLAPLERARWRQDWEELRALWIQTEPSDIDQIDNYLTHPVPPETLAYIKEEYKRILPLIQQVNSTLMPKVIYSFMRNEGRPFGWEERRRINQEITKVRLKVDVLAKSLNKDPYLLTQKQYWERVFTTFNPLLKGLVSQPTFLFRQDNRQFVDYEFNLHYPDGTRPYLKDSHSLIEGDEDYEEDADSYAAVRAKMRNPPITQEEAAREREELLPYIPENLHIAIINDDYPPIVNARGWCKNGYLGKNATLSEFRDGFAFMETVRKGARYDLIITDLLVPNGGVAMMKELRTLDSNAIVIASSKFYPGEGDQYSQNDLFNSGMDGYMWYNSNLNEGMYGYIQYLRQMKLYFDYKKQHGWER